MSDLGTSARTVLVVDDEPQLIRLIASAFERAGYRVLSAGDGPGALAAFSQSPDPIAAAFLDVQIPPNGVQDTLDEMLEARSDLGVVLTSGCDLDPALRSKIEAVGGLFVRKPFRTVDALRALRGVMGER